MQSMTLEQLRAANDAGGVSGVTLKGQGGAFLVQIDTRSGSGALLSKARSTEPRRFGNPLAAFNVLREDVEQPCLDTDEVLDAAPSSDQRRFRVPPIIGLDD